MKFTADQARKFFEARIGQSLPFRDALVVRCPFHQDSTASLSLNLPKGVWKCHAGCGDGGLIDFEMRMNGGTREEAAHRIEEILGADHLFESQRTKPVAVYRYVDAQGILLFEKLRYADPKRFVQRRPLANGKYEYKLDGVEKPLYRLPELLTANEVFICEGEKDADNVRQAFSKYHVAATTNFGGAGKWRDEYAVYFAGKRVVIFVDNDDPGRAHAEMVAQSVRKYAVGIKVIALPGLPEHGDVSDWLQSHSVEQLIEEIKRTPQWHPKVTPHVDLIEATKLALSTPAEVDWLVNGVIPKGANGIITGEPKAGKSLAVIDLAMAIATGTPWLGFTTKRVKTALISREDYPGMTAQRIGALFRGSIRPDLEHWMYVNTRWQTPTFSLENDEQVARLIVELKQVEAEFACFDVFRRIHGADENDNTEMQLVLDQLSRIQSEAGCAIGLVHHVSKATDGRIFRHIRGASAIDGWTEWAMAFTVTNPDDEQQRNWVRKIEFETKAAAAASPIYFQIESTGDSTRLNAVAENSLGVKL